MIFSVLVSSQEELCKVITMLAEVRVPVGCAAYVVEFVDNKINTITEYCAPTPFEEPKKDLGRKPNPSPYYATPARQESFTGTQSPSQE